MKADATAQPWLPPGPAMLFCPADRPDRYGKAAERSDVVIIDLEDAVAPADKPAAREALVAHPLDPASTIVRLNPFDSGEFEADLEALAKTQYRCVMLAKAESAEQVEQVPVGVLALIETPLGVVRADEIAAASNCVGLMWGAEDLVAAMGGNASRFAAMAPATGAPAMGQYRDAPRYARARVAMAAAAFGRFAVDAVHLDIADHDGLRAEADDAVALGFMATACIHPGQVPVIRDAYAPTPEEVSRAERIVSAARNEAGVFQLDGRMVDAPVISLAHSVLRRAQATGTTTIGVDHD